jgi:hypothetical protein
MYNYLRGTGFWDCDSVEVHRKGPVRVLVDNGLLPDIYPY